MTTEIIFVSDVPIGTQARIARLVKGWTQWECAFYATEFVKRRGCPPIVKIQPSDVSFLELGRGIKPWRKQPILHVLGLIDG